MKPCLADYCPNAAGPNGRCDDCTTERRGALPRGITKVKNNTGKPIEIKPFAAWKQDHP